MFARWRSIFAEIAEAAGYPAPSPSAVEPPPDTFANSEQARQHWRTVLAAFRDSFQNPPPVEEVRNWNSVHGRRKHYRGVVHRRNHHHCITVEALEELGADLTPLRRVTTGVRDFSLLDWQQDLEEDQEVHFIAFPNPSVEERDKVSRIIRLLNVPDEAEERCPPSLPRSPVPSQATGAAISADSARSGHPVKKTASSSTAEASPLTDNSPPAFASTAFADLMQWSEDFELGEPEAPAASSAARSALTAADVASAREHAAANAAAAAAAAHIGAQSSTAAAAAAAAQDGMQHPMQLSLEGYLPFGGDGAPQRPPGNNFQMPPGVHALSAPPPRPRGSAPPPMMGMPPGSWMPAGGMTLQLPGMAIGRSNGRGMPQAPRSPLYFSPFAGPGRSPMICPRSPYAAYFDD